MYTPKKDDRIVRIGPNGGKTGSVIEVNPYTERARILWTDGSPRTWIAFRFLQKDLTGPGEAIEGLATFKAALKISGIEVTGTISTDNP